MNSLSGQLSNKIKDLRARAGWSPERLAHESGVAISTIYRIEAGSWPSADNMVRIAQALGKPVPYFYGAEVVKIVEKEEDTSKAFMNFIDAVSKLEKKELVTLLELFTKQIEAFSGSESKKEAKKA
jgi:transcriptional regulator with XRE-family HTH domain